MANDAKDVQVDAQGRVQLPEYFDWVRWSSKQVVVVGSYTWVEIWNQDLYHNYLKTVEPNAEKIAESIETTWHKQPTINQ